MTVRGRRTQPLLMMAIQITHKQERGTDNRQSAWQPLMLVNNQKSGRLGQGCDKDCTHKGSVSLHKPKKPAFRNNHTQILVGEMLCNHLERM